MFYGDKFKELSLGSVSKGWEGESTSAYRHHNKGKILGNKLASN